MNPLFKLWYLLTAYVPRRLPATEAEFQHFRWVMLEAYGLMDDDQIWYCVMGHLGSTPANHLRRPWARLANAAKRLHVNALANEKRGQAGLRLQERALAIAKQMKEAQDAEEAGAKLQGADAGEEQASPKGPPKDQVDAQTTPADLPTPTEEQRERPREENGECTR